MKLNVIEAKDNPLLKRKEIRYFVEFDNDVSPSRDVIREVISRNYKADSSLVIVDKNLQLTGSHSMEGYSKIYQNKVSLATSSTAWSKDSPNNWGGTLVTCSSSMIVYN